MLKAIVLIVGSIFSLTIATAYSHEASMGWKYPFSCCGEGDCSQIAGESVKQTPNGYEISLLPGEHPQIKTKSFHYMVPYAIARTSLDGEYHLCLAPEPSLAFRCFFKGLEGV